MYQSRLQLSLLFLGCMLSIDLTPCKAQTDINHSSLFSEENLKIIAKFMEIMQNFLEQHLITESLEENSREPEAPSYTITAATPASLTPATVAPIAPIAPITPAPSYTLTPATVAPIAPITPAPSYTLTPATVASIAPITPAPIFTPVPSTTLSNDIPLSRKRFCFKRYCVKFKNDKGYIY